MRIDELQRIKQWHLRHRDDHPVETRLWDFMLTCWLAGWVGWIPTFAFHAIWAAPVCFVAMSAPTIYVAWRMRAHRARRVRCDWLQ